MNHLYLVALFLWPAIVGVVVHQMLVDKMVSVGESVQKEAIERAVNKKVKSLSTGGVFGPSEFEKALIEKAVEKEYDNYIEAQRPAIEKMISSDGLSEALRRKMMNRLLGVRDPF